MGNDAMQGTDDVATALQDVADRIDTTGAESGAIRDGNGNTVGRWELR